MGIGNHRHRLTSVIIGTNLFKMCVFPEGDDHRPHRLDPLYKA